MCKDSVRWQNLKIGIISGIVGVMTLFLLLLLISAFGDKILIQDRWMQITLKLSLLLSGSSCAIVISQKIQNEILIAILAGEGILFLTTLLPSVIRKSQLDIMSMAVNIIILALGSYLGSFFKKTRHRRKNKKRRNYRT